jgi:hypothetical protein
LIPAWDNSAADQPRASALLPAEERLVAAINADEPLDLSDYTESDKTLRASFLRDVLLGQHIDGPDPISLRLCGARIEGDLDLIDVETYSTVDITNCQVARIRLNGAAITRDVGDKKWWHRLLGKISVMAKEPALITVLLFAFVVIKVVYIAQGDIQTALGVFNSASLTTVIVGGLLSAFPIVFAGILGLATYELIRGASFRKPPGVVEVVIWGAAALGCLFLTPWPIFAFTVVLGIISGLVVRRWLRSEPEAAQDPKSRKSRMARVAGYSVLFLVSLYFVLNPLLYAVWLPHETLTFKKVTPITGYVLSDANGWISVLRTNERRIYRYRTEDVLKRILCRGTSVPMPYFPVKQLKSADPLLQRFADIQMLESCSEVRSGLRKTAPSQQK